MSRTVSQNWNVGVLVFVSFHDDRLDLSFEVSHFHYRHEGLSLQLSQSHITHLVGGHVLSYLVRQDAFWKEPTVPEAVQYLPELL